jgi:hypothetical protein
MHRLLRRSATFLVELAALLYLASTVYELVSQIIVYAHMPAWEMLGGSLIQAGSRIFAALALLAIVYRFIQLTDDMRQLKIFTLPDVSK